MKILNDTQSETSENRQNGFTLLETLVAMMILSISLVIILQQFSEALNTGHISESYTRAVWHAREKMDELLLNETPAEEARQGDFGDGYRWRYRVERLQFDSPAPRKDLESFSLTVWVHWKQGQNEKQLDISTLTIAKAPDNIKF